MQLDASRSTQLQLNRRAFLKRTSVFACGFSGAGLLLAGARQNPAAALPADDQLNILGPRAPYSPQIGTLVSMLTWMRRAILAPTEGLTVADLDYLHDQKANTIGALLLHLAATERHYQIHTFEGRKWNDWDDETHKRWSVAGALGEQARKQIKGQSLRYYIDTLNELRDQTLAQLRKRDDAWLMQVDPDWQWGPTNNFCKWFHVCEHESHHSGQIAWIKRRLPGASETNE